MDKWYLCKTWTKEDEEEFFIKLNRSRKYKKPQYLKTRAFVFIETKDEGLLNVAENLLNKILVEHFDEKFEISETYNFLGKIYKLKKNYEKALYYFESSLNFEKEFPEVKVKTTSYLDYSEIVVLLERTELYGKVKELLLKELKNSTLIFPTQNYIMFSLLSIISNHENQYNEAKLYAELAEKNATAERNTLWNPKKQKIGLVKERNKWFDKLLNNFK